MSNDNIITTLCKIESKIEEIGLSDADMFAVAGSCACIALAMIPVTAPVALAVARVLLPYVMGAGARLLTRQLVGNGVATTLTGTGARLLTRRLLT